MRPESIMWFGIGLIAGVALIFYSVDAPIEQRCETYKVKLKPVTAYVLKAPTVPAIEHTVVVKENCPVVLKNEEKVNTSDERVKPVNTHHHRRHRRYWR